MNRFHITDPSSSTIQSSLTLFVTISEYWSTSTTSYTFSTAPTSLRCLRPDSREAYSKKSREWLVLAWTYVRNFNLIFQNELQTFKASRAENLPAFEALGFLSLRDLEFASPDIGGSVPAAFGSSVSISRLLVKLRLSASLISFTVTIEW